MATPRIVVEDATGQLLDSAGEVTFGTRTGVGVVLDDAIAAARHCAFAWDGGSFVVRDLGSVTGTWVDGSRTTGAVPLRDGSQVVFGSSRAIAKVEDRDGTPVLVLQLQRNGFWWRKAGKKVFDNDPDALVRSEVAFGRFPLLRASNRVAIVLAIVLLLGGTFVAAVLEPLADAGPLLPPHALVASDRAVDAVHTELVRCRALADEQGCNVCHETGTGVPEQKCLQCHTDFTVAGGRRHPYVGDGKLGPLTGITVDEQFCVICHVDHQGNDWLKPRSDELVGKCEACHGAGTQRDDLARRAPPQLPPERQLAYSSIRFPHDQHVAKGIDCAVCHVVDADVRARRDGGLPDDPDRQDFAEVKYETCRSCHVDGAPAVGMTAAQQEQWRASPEHRWVVRWHGTDDGGVHCKACHVETQRDGLAAFGPGMKSVVRPVATPAQYAAERALYASGQKLHEEQFRQHAGDRACTVCHLDGKVRPAEEPPRSFWHALHLADGALTPAAGAGGAISADGAAGCVSCHGDLRGAKALVDASTASYHWPSTEAAQAACKDCHREGERALPLRATATTVAAERRSAPGAVADFPHDVHVTSATFGKSGALADGCFACHAFERPEGAGEFQFVPRTLPKAADCTQCHTAHAHVGGGACEQCHPAVAERGSSFTLAARSAMPPQPLRAWPGRNAFSHLSRGHANVACSECHDAKQLAGAKDLAGVALPDDATKACRDCHLQKQFHWR